MAQPILSLITGTRNREDDFRRLLDSVQRNTEVEWEMVVADARDEPIRTENLTLNVRVIPERPRRGQEGVGPGHFAGCARRIPRVRIAGQPVHPDAARARLVPEQVDDPVQ